MPPHWQLGPVTIDDADDISRNNVSAFWADDFWRLSILPADTTVEDRIRQTAKRQPRSLITGRAEKRFQKAVHPDTGALVGFIRWEFPKGLGAAADGSLRWPEALGPQVSEADRRRYDARAQEVQWSSRADLDAVDDAVVAARDRLLGTKPYAKIDYLAVLPEYQRQGIATALVGAGVKEMDKAGIPTYLFACRAGRTVYKHFGFRELYRATKDMAEFGGKGEHGLYLMVREVGGANSEEES